MTLHKRTLTLTNTHLGRGGVGGGGGGEPTGGEEGGGGGGGVATHMVEEVRLVSLCLSLPSRTKSRGANVTLH